MTCSDWISLATTVVTAVGAGAVFWQLRLLGRQIKLEHYSEYTKRYQEIALKFPEDVNTINFQLVGRNDYAQTMRYMRAYFDLCFEEWDLNQKRLIDPAFWSVWEGGMKFAFSKAAFQQAWKTIKADSQFGSSFEQFVEENMR